MKRGEHQARLTTNHQSSDETGEEKITFSAFKLCSEAAAAFDPPTVLLFGSSQLSRDADASVVT